MEIFLLVAGLIVVLLFVGGNSKGTRKLSKSEAEALRVKIVIEESGKQRSNDAYEDRKPALFNAPRSTHNGVSKPDVSEITRGLIIAEPWISKILNGEKVWEMRSRESKIRGPIALIKKGSKRVVGICKLVGAEGPFDNQELALNEHKHQISPDRYEAPGYKWRYAWMLSEIEVLAQPVPYEHPSGAVTWVNLDENVITQLAAACPSECSIPPSDDDNSAICPNQPEMARMITVPFSHDGTCFCPQQCAIGGRYLIGSKHGNVEFSDYDEALDYMRNMAVPRWGRPGADGNWEIVSACVWKAVIAD